jgi:RNA polymerase sigma-70 factor, ECF subfamily
MRSRDGHGIETRRRQDERRLEELYGAHADAVLTYLRHRTDRETAQEVLTDTFVTAWRKLGDVPEQPRGWLFAVARRVLANHVRSQGRTAAMVERVASEQWTATSSGELQEAIARHDIVAALSRLDEPDREVLLLAGWYELSGAEAAQALGCTRTAHGVRLHRARRRLRAALAELPPEGVRGASAQALSTTARPAWEANR